MGKVIEITNSGIVYILWKETMEEAKLIYNHTKKLASSLKSTIDLYLVDEDNSIVELSVSGFNPSHKFTKTISKIQGERK